MFLLSARTISSEAVRNLTFIMCTDIERYKTKEKNYGQQIKSRISMICGINERPS